MTISKSAPTIRICTIIHFLPWTSRNILIVCAVRKSKYVQIVSLIVWVDMRSIEPTDERNKELVKRDILRVLNSMLLKSGTFTVNRVYEKGGKEYFSRLYTCRG